MTRGNTRLIDAVRDSFFASLPGSEALHDSGHDENLAESNRQCLIKMSSHSVTDVLFGLINYIDLSIRGKMRHTDPVEQTEAWVILLNTIGDCLEYHWEIKAAHTALAVEEYERALHERRFEDEEGGDRADDDEAGPSDEQLQEEEEKRVQEVLAEFPEVEESITIYATEVLCKLARLQESREKDTKSKIAFPSLTPACKRAVFLLSRTNFSSMFASIPTTLATFVKAADDNLPIDTLILLPYMHFTQSNLIRLIDAVSDVITRSKKVYQLLMGDCVSKAIDAWIDSFPEDLVALHETQNSTLATNCQALLQSFLSIGEKTVNRRVACWPVIMRLLMLNPSQMRVLADSSAHSNLVTRSFINGLKKSLSSQKSPLYEVALQCYVHASIATSFLDKNKTMVYAALLKDIEIDFKEKLFNDEKPFFTQFTEAEERLLVGALVAFTRSSPKSTVNEYIERFLLEPGKYRLEFVIVVIRALIVTSDKQADENLVHARTYLYKKVSHLVRRLLHWLVGEVTRHLTATSASTATSQKLHKKDQREQSIVPLLFHALREVLTLLTIDPTYAFHHEEASTSNGGSNEGLLQDTQSLFTSICMCTQDANFAPIAQYAVDVLIRHHDTDVIPLWGEVEDRFWDASRDIFLQLSYYFSTGARKNHLAALDTFKRLLLARIAFITETETYFRTEKDLDAWMVSRVHLERVLLTSLASNDWSIVTTTLQCIEHLCEEASVLVELSETHADEADAPELTMPQSHQVFLELGALRRTISNTSSTLRNTHQKICKILRNITIPTQGTQDAWEALFRRYKSWIHELKCALDDSTSDMQQSAYPAEVHAHLYFLCSLGGVCLLDPEGKLTQMETQENVTTSKIGNISLVPHVKEVITSTEEFLTCDNKAFGIELRATIKEAFGCNMHPVLLPTLLESFNKKIETFFTREKGTVDLSPQNTLYLEQTISILYLILQSDSDTGGYLLLADIESLLTNCVNLLLKHPDAVPNIKIQFCRVVELVVAKRDIFTFKHELQFRNGLIDKIIAFFSTGVHEMTLSKDVIDLDVAVACALASLVKSLPLQSLDDDVANTVDVRSGLFLKYFTFFINVTNKCNSYLAKPDVPAPAPKPFEPFVGSLNPFSRRFSVAVKGGGNNSNHSNHSGSGNMGNTGHGHGHGHGHNHTASSGSNHSNTHLSAPQQPTIMSHAPLAVNPATSDLAEASIPTSDALGSGTTAGNTSNMGNPFGGVNSTTIASTHAGPAGSLNKHAAVKPSYKRERIQYLRTKIATAMSHLLSANVDVGLSHAISMGYHEDSAVRIAFTDVMNKVLHQGAEFETLAATVTQDRYAKMLALLTEKNLEIVLSLANCLPTKDLDDAAAVFVRVFTAKRLLMPLCVRLANAEVLSSRSAPQIFRRNSLATKVCTSAILNEGGKYLERILSPFIKEIIEGDTDYEIDERKVDDPSKLESNRMGLESLAARVLDTIMSAEADLPELLKVLCVCSQRVSAQAFPDSSTSAVGGLVFLRFFNPAIVSPASYGVIDDSLKIPPKALRTLLLLTKVLQTIANGQEFSGVKETYMARMNEFVRCRLALMGDYLLSVANPATMSPKAKRTLSSLGITIESATAVDTGGDMDASVNAEKRVSGSAVPPTGDPELDQLAAEIALLDGEEEDGITSEDTHALHRLLAENLSQIGLEISALQQSSFGKSEVYNRLAALMAQLGDPPKENRIRESLKGKKFNPVTKNLDAFMAMCDFSQTDTSVVESLQLFYHSGYSKAGNPVFYLIARRYSPNKLPANELLYHIFFTLKRFLSSTFDIVVDLTEFALDNFPLSITLSMFSAMLPTDIVSHVGTAYFVNCTTAFRNFAKITHHSVLATKFHKKIKWVDAVQLNEFIKDPALPASTHRLVEATDIFSSMTLYQTNKKTVPVTFSVGPVGWQISYSGTHKVYATTAKILDVVSVSSLTDIKLPDGVDDRLVIEASGGRVFPLSAPNAAEAQRLLEIVGQNWQRHLLTLPANRSEWKVLRPDDVPATLLNMALLNLGSENPRLRLASYNLLANVTSTFDFQIGGEVREADVIAIPANNTNFINSISKTLSKAESRLTLEFLDECITGILNSKPEQKHMCMEYMAPWLPNLHGFLGSTPEYTAKVTEIIKRLVELTVWEVDLSPALQAKVWTAIGGVEALAPLALDYMIEKSFTYNDVTVETERLADTAVTLASVNTPLISKLLVERFVAVIEECNSRTDAGPLEADPMFPRLMLLARLVLKTSFNNRLDIDTNLPALWFIITVLIGIGPPLLRATMHAIVANIVHSMCTSLELCSEDIKALGLLQHGFVETDFYSLFGISAKEASADLVYSNIDSAADQDVQSFPQNPFHPLHRKHFGKGLPFGGKSGGFVFPPKSATPAHHTTPPMSSITSPTGSKSTTAATNPFSSFLSAQQQSLHSVQQAALHEHLDAVAEDEAAEEEAQNELDEGNEQHDTEAGVALIPNEAVYDEDDEDEGDAFDDADNATDESSLTGTSASRTKGQRAGKDQHRPRPAQAATLHKRTGSLGSATASASLTMPSHEKRRATQARLRTDAADGKARSHKLPHKLSAPVIGRAATFSAKQVSFGVGAKPAFSGPAPAKPRRKMSSSVKLSTATLVRAIQTLRDIVRTAGQERYGGWAQQWLNLCMQASNKSSKCIKERAVIALGIIPEELTAETKALVQGLLREAVQAREVSLIDAILSCLSFLLQHTGGAEGGVDYHIMMFWAAVMILELNIVRLYSSALSVIEAVIETVASFEGLLMQGKTFADVMLTPVVLQSPAFGALERNIGLSFSRNFSFALAATLVRAFDHPHTSTVQKARAILLTLYRSAREAANPSQHTIHKRASFFDITTSYNSVNSPMFAGPDVPHGSREDEREAGARVIISQEMLGYACALLPKDRSVQEDCCDDVVDGALGHATGFPASNGGPGVVGTGTGGGLRHRPRQHSLIGVGDGMMSFARQRRVSSGHSSALDLLVSANAQKQQDEQDGHQHGYRFRRFIQACDGREDLCYLMVAMMCSQLNQSEHQLTPKAFLLEFMADFAELEPVVFSLVEAAVLDVTDGVIKQRQHPELIHPAHRILETRLSRWCKCPREICHDTYITSRRSSASSDGGQPLVRQENSSSKKEKKKKKWMEGFGHSRQSSAVDDTSPTALTSSSSGLSHGAVDLIAKKKTLVDTLRSNDTATAQGVVGGVRSGSRDEHARCGPTCVYQPVRSLDEMCFTGLNDCALFSDLREPVLAERFELCSKTVSQLWERLFVSPDTATSDGTPSTSTASVPEGLFSRNASVAGVTTGGARDVDTFRQRSQAVLTPSSRRDSVATEGKETQPVTASEAAVAATRGDASLDDGDSGSHDQAGIAGLDRRSSKA